MTYFRTLDKSGGTVNIFLISPPQYINRNLRKRIPSDMGTHQRRKSACASMKSAWRNFASLAIQNVPSEDSDQTVQMHKLI